MKTTYVYKEAFGESLLADIERLRNELVEARRAFDMALRVAEKDKQALLDRVEALQAENEQWHDIAERCFAAAMKNAVALADGRKRGA